MTDRFAVVPASYVFLLRDGTAGPEVLLQLRQNTGYMDDHWAAAAAGHVERGETAYDAARREAARGARHRPTSTCVFELTMQRTQHDRADRRAGRLLLHRPHLAGEPRIVEPEKCADLRWCPLDALPDPVVPHEALRTGIAGLRASPYLTFGFTPERSTP